MNFLKILLVSLVIFAFPALALASDEIATTQPYENQGETLPVEHPQPETETANSHDPIRELKKSINRLERIVQNNKRSAEKSAMERSQKKRCFRHKRKCRKR